MTTSQPYRELSDRLSEATADGNTVLFAGAGVSARAGYRTWRDYTKTLTERVRAYEPPTADVMALRLAQADMPEAFEQLFRARAIPDGEKYRWIVDELHDGTLEPNRLRPLVALPFRFIVTTNFDYALHDAWSSEYASSPRVVEGVALRQGPHRPPPFIARIHGSIDDPLSMVLSTSHYEKVQADNAYQDFLRFVLTRNRCLFIGFSMTDPAVKGLLQQLAANYVGALPSTHLALLPSSDEQLRAELARVGVEVVSYDSSDAHGVLWGAVSEAGRAARAVQPVAPLPPQPLPIARAALAASYARSKLGARIAPVRDLAIDGILLALLAEHGAGLDEPGLARNIAVRLGLTAEGASVLVANSLSRLDTIGAVERRDDTLVVAIPGEDLDVDLRTLARSVRDRLLVREGVSATDDDLESIRSALEELTLLRGLELGAHFAGAPAPLGVRLSSIDDAVRRADPSLREDIRSATVAALRSLLTEPNSAESEILASLGRLAFGVEVALQHIHFATTETGLFPSRVYLDATIVLPLLADGHPLRETYQATLERLREALHGQGRELEVIVAAEFLNEVIAHRRRAIDLVRDARLVRRETLKRHSLYFGQDGTNVFVGAYATAIGREGEVTESFKEWLDREAPYQTEAELADHLAAIGIRTESLLGSADDHERARVTRLHGALVAGYSERHRDKANVLIDHEARQLARLERLSGTDGTAVFVTADATLRSIASEHPEAATAGRLLLSSVGFVELIDFVAGLRPVHRSLARMLWGIRAVEGLDEQRETLRAYFTDLALTEYSSAIHFDLQRLVESYVEQTITDAAAERVKLAPSSEPDRASASKLLDRKADDFYRQMSAEIAERDRQQ